MTGKNQVNANDPKASEKAEERIVEAEWYEQFFDSKLRGVGHEHEGRPHLTENVLEEGADRAAMAILAVALTEDLSVWSLSTLRDIYDALNSNPTRGQFMLTIQRRSKGRPKPSFEEAMSLQEADRNIERLATYLVDDGVKKEAVVSALIGRRKMSRAGVFRRLARAQRNRKSR